MKILCFSIEHCLIRIHSERIWKMQCKPKKESIIKVLANEIVTKESMEETIEDIGFDIVKEG